MPDVLNPGESVIGACGWTASIAQSDHDKYIKKLKSAVRLEERWKLFMDSESKPKTSNGEKNLKNLVAMLKRADEVGFRRSQQQIQFHKAFIAACLQKVLYTIQ